VSGLKQSIQRAIFRPYAILASLPFLFRKQRVAPPKLVGSAEWRAYLSQNFNQPGMRILEVGSRVVTGANLRHLFDKATYIGFDFYPGENVDIAGDAHKLSS
jgi:hypothetical protein